MRVIKFRGYLKKENKMFPVCDLNFNGVDQWPVGISSCGRLDCGLCEDHYERADVEVMQHTGLKDKNGREIYEGDIVKRIETTGYTFVGEVIYEEYGFGIKLNMFFKPLSTKGKYDDGKSSFNYSVEYEIIGNIYENPKLLVEMS